MAFSRRAMCDRSRSATQNTSTIFKKLNKTCIQFYRWESRIDGEAGNAKKWPCGSTGFQVSIGGTMRYKICSWDYGPKKGLEGIWAFSLQNGKYDNCWRGPDKCEKMKKFLKREISSGSQISCRKFNFSDFWPPIFPMRLKEKRMNFHSFGWNRGGQAIRS